MPALLAATAMGFTGLALLLPVAPMWAVHIGADEFGAGLVNSVLMASTVLTQLVIGRVLARIGARVTLAAGLVLLGAPALVHIFAESLWAVLVLAALRGLGFGILTVCAVDGIAGLFAQEHRGRAVGAYGLSIAAPQFVLTPLGPWCAEHLGYPAVFIFAAAPLLAVPIVLAFTRPVPPPPAPEGRPPMVARGLVRPIAALVVITAAGGGILTFAPQFGSAGTAFAALLGLTGAAALTRWRIGAIADRHGPARFIAPMLGLGALGLVAIAVGIATSAAVVIAGSVLVGVAYGSLQNLTLVEAFAAGGEHARGAVSVAWNVGFDSGTGLGALAIGALATAGSFPMAFVVAACACAMVGVVWIRSR
ncbi:MFS transporter [Mycolicibacterium frederiksbergense]